MICLRCGYCCKHSLVVVAKNPNKGFNKKNFKTYVGDGTPCHHLSGFIPGQFKCKVHNKKWYNKTPCHAHIQYELSNSFCRIGEHNIREFIKTKCVCCGYCCSVGCCQWGKLGKSQWKTSKYTKDVLYKKSKCKFLLKPNKFGQRFCGKYQIIWRDPMFGSACSSVLFNETREAVIKKLLAFLKMNNDFTKKEKHEKAIFTAHKRPYKKSASRK